MNNLIVLNKNDNVGVSQFIIPEKTKIEGHEISTIDPIPFGHKVCLKTIKKGDPLFIDSQGIIYKYDGEQLIWPVFIGEVAYKEKKIAMSYTKKEVISSNNQWVYEFESL